jgi:hypothetical protein
VLPQRRLLNGLHRSRQDYLLVSLPLAQPLNLLANRLQTQRSSLHDSRQVYRQLSPAIIQVPFLLRNHHRCPLLEYKLK